MSEQWLQDVRDEIAKGDTLIEVTSWGTPEPEYLIASSAADRAVAKARAFYVEGTISVEQFESVLNECLTPSA